MRHAIILFSLLTFAACATQRAERKSAERLAGQISQMQTNLTTLAESRQNIARARALVSQRLLRSAIETEVFNADTLDNLGGDARTLFDSSIKDAAAAVARRAKADAEIAAAEEAAKAATARVNTRSDDLGATAKLLSQLAEKQSWREQARFYFHFFSEVQDSLEEMDQTARQHSEIAQDQTGAQQPPVTPQPAAQGGQP